MIDQQQYSQRPSPAQKAWYHIAEGGSFGGFGLWAVRQASSEIVQIILEFQFPDAAHGLGFKNANGPPCC